MEGMWVPKVKSEVSGSQIITIEVYNLLLYLMMSERACVTETRKVPKKKKKGGGGIPVNALEFSLQII